MAALVGQFSSDCGGCNSGDERNDDNDDDDDDGRRGDDERRERAKDDNHAYGGGSRRRGGGCAPLVDYRDVDVESHEYLTAGVWTTVWFATGPSRDHRPAAGATHRTTPHLSLSMRQAIRRSSHPALVEPASSTVLNDISVRLTACVVSSPVVSGRRARARTTCTHAHTRTCHTALPPAAPGPRLRAAACAPRTYRHAHMAGCNGGNAAFLLTPAAKIYSAAPFCAIEANQVSRL